MKNRLSTLLLCFLMVTAVFADLPFRNHRYDGFKVLKVTPDNIVFVGNSITNMHEWWEAFDNPAIINRGTSGAVSDELLANLESVIAGKPKKIFLMIGTNDLGTAGINNTEHVVGNLEKILDRIRHESPATEIYVQSILPCNKDLNLLTRTNAAIEETCGRHEGVTFINLWDDLIGVRNGQNSLDRLHLLASGYRIWCKKIAPYVGSDCVYQDSYENLTAGLGGSYGMRASYFGMLPVKATDVLMIGDGTVHGGEWRELLHCDKVKNRGTGWGYPGADMATIQKEIPVILTGNGNKEAPAKIFLYVGAQDANGSTDLNVLKTSYAGIITEIRKYAPATKVYIMSLLPVNNASTNSNRVVPFNEKLKEIAAARENVEYIDVYTSMVANGVANTAYFNGNYVWGKGYARLSQLLAPYLQEEGAVATTDEEAAAIYDTYAARTTLMQNLVSAADLRFGEGAGTYPSDKKAEVEVAVAAAEDLLKQENPAVADITAAASRFNSVIRNLLSSINQPALSDGSTEIWHRIFTPLRGNRYLTSNGEGAGVTGEEKNLFAKSMWKFTVRQDGTVNIINRNDGSYLNPSASYNTQIATSASEPAKGWQLEYAATSGLYIIHSGKVELNQTQAGLGYKVYNWSAGETGTDRDDMGCQFCVEEVDFEPVTEPDPLDEGWYSFSVATGSDATMQGYVENGTNTILNAETEYRQTATNFYPLRIGVCQADKAPLAWLYVTRVNNMYRIQTLNGHTVNENCTASRDQQQAPTTISGVGTVSIDKWHYYNPADGAEKPYVGKSSDSGNTFGYIRIKDQELAAYDHYVVSVTGAPLASEIGRDVKLTCTRSDCKGIAAVYDHGHFFFPKGTAVTAADFTATVVENLPSSVSIVKDTIYVTYSVTHPVAALLEEAETLLSLAGPGYPRTESQARAALTEAVATASVGPDNEETAAPLRTAIASFLADTDLEMPQAGKAYTLTCVQKSGTTYAFCAAEDGSLSIAGAGVPASSLGNRAVFVCGEKDGRYYFVYGTGNYLVWKGHREGANNNSGYVGEYDAGHCLFTLGTGNAYSFGTFWMQAPREDVTKQGIFIVTSGGEFNAWTSGVAWTDAYSNLFRLEEADYPNTVGTVALEGESRVGVFSAPFPTLLPEGAKAYSAMTDGKEVGLLEIGGNVIPAATGVAVVGPAESYVMVPAAGSAEVPAENLLTASGAEGVTLEAGVPAYILTEKDGIACFTLLADSRTVAPNSAWLTVADTADALRVRLGRVTGIGQIREKADADAVLYDLGGRRVESASRGIYISGGKKIFVK